MTCATCKFLKNTQPGAALSATALYPCVAPVSYPAKEDGPPSCGGRDGMRRRVFIGMGEGCPAYIAAG